MRVRGLKPFLPVRSRTAAGVAPRAGAWIETAPKKPLSVTTMVAPRAGAWIETLGVQKADTNYESHPVRVRGLKRPMYPAAELC